MFLPYATTRSLFTRSGSKLDLIIINISGSTIPVYIDPET